MRKPLASAFVVGVASLGCSVRSWSFDKKKHNGVVVKKNSNTDDDKLLFSPLSAATEADDDTTTTTSSRRRRQMMKKCGGAVITGLFGGGGGGIFFAHPDSANAMCLQGDERPECIGVYKVPPDETVLKYAETLGLDVPAQQQQQQQRTPDSYESAIETLNRQLTVADEIRTCVSAGNLEEAGIKVLSAIPKVTVSGRFVLNEIETKILGEQQQHYEEEEDDDREFGGDDGAASSSSSSSSPQLSAVTTTTTNNNEKNDNKNIKKNTITIVDDLKISMIENQWECVNGYWGECDVVIGQGLRGELGVSAVAQITVLDTLRDAKCALDDFLSTAEKLHG